MIRQFLIVPIAFVLITASSMTVLASRQGWQQRVEYTISVELNTESNQLRGKERVVYHNNSPDTLYSVYFHLYYNAFQPGSLMDKKSDVVPDPDPRIGHRIARLSDNEKGFQKVSNLRQDGLPVSSREVETVLIVNLAKPLAPHSSCTFSLDFIAQIPKQIRRTGRTNSEGVEYTIAQWYPKIAAYDESGWHANQYIEREFYSVWGNFDVRIRTDADYILAGTGVLVNADETGHGYSTGRPKTKRGKLEWHFTAENVHDFVWAADRHYDHTIAKVPDGPELHFFFKRNTQKTQHWNQFPPYAVAAFEYLQATYGKYPYPTFSIIQGGDGGMEYPMCAIILGEGTLAGTIDVFLHEVAHAWFQGAVGTNESLYPWMDEGFTEFAENDAKAALFGLKDPHEGTYNYYKRTVIRSLEEPASLMADYYRSGVGYKTGSYIKGELFLTQLRYIMGDAAFRKTMRDYYAKWIFGHPAPDDFIMVAERTSGMQLKWFMNQWINTTRTIDYSVDSVSSDPEGTTIITLANKGQLAIPLEVLVTFEDGQETLFHIPLLEMLEPKGFDPSLNVVTLPPSSSVTLAYQFQIESGHVVAVTIDPRNQTADINRDNNSLRSR